MRFPRRLDLYPVDFGRTNTQKAQRTGHQTMRQPGQGGKKQKVNSIEEVNMKIHQRIEEFPAKKNRKN